MSEVQGKKILLAHGGGGRLTGELIESMILPRFGNAVLDELGDSARLDIDAGAVSS